MIVLRQVSATMARGNVSAMADARVFPYRLRDVDPRNKLRIADGLVTSGYFILTATNSKAISLPSDYDSANRLAIFLSTNNVAKAVLVHPTLGSQSFLLRGTNGTTDGDHPGQLVCQSRTTSLTVSVPTAGSDVLFEYFMFQIPDLTVPASWQRGAQTIGTV